MSDLLARIKAKKEAAKKAEEAAETKSPNPDDYARVDEEYIEDQNPPEPAKPAKPIPSKPVDKPEPEREVLMGITVEDLQERIAHVFEHAKTAEKHEIKEDMDGLKQAIHSNPSIVQHLLPQDIGKMVGTLRKIHSEARAEAAQSPAKKKATKSAEAKAAKELMKKPMSKEDLDSLMDEL